MTTEQIYHRSTLRSDSCDAYNSLASRFPARINTANEEYWSNGFVTHFSTPSKPLASLESPHICSSSTFSDDSSIMAASPEQSDTAAPSPKSRETSNVALKSILSGSIAGITSTVLFHPTDVLRTKVQSASFSAASSTSSASSSSAAAVAAHKNMRPASVFMHTIRNGGCRALYTGMTPVIGAQAVYKATVFTTNNLSRRALIDFRTNERAKVGVFTPYTPTLFDTWFCGATGGFINALLFVSPVEFVRNQQILQHSRVSTAEGASSEAMRKKLKSPIDIITKTIKKRGPLGLWRGTGVTVLRDSLGCGGFFVMYELGKRNLGPYLGGNGSTATMLASGACAGLGVSVHLLVVYLCTVR
mmetsp:Transcript_1221/g.2173  ORF Transcript_1221/g.2173 Transcript_1221/m.2173 type:complete len:359 (-) Transcript_1221:495-1571(-)